ncbi:MAG TPA: sugar phosphate isomerase/epimerase [Armatimonadota bacterium]|nr:sugar phosphate isomerase/epimerase [Armatimonadota bacterium]
MAKLPIGLQLYSVRKDCEQDLPGVLKEVARMGYEGVEFAGYYGRSAPELRAMLDDLGLKCCGTHTGLSTILGDELERTAEFNRTLGNRYLIVPGLPEERRSSREAWLETARLFTEAAGRARPHGMVVGYHNHAVEFQPMDGELPWDTFFSNTPDEVVMQVDIGNALHGGGDPIPYIERYPGRAMTVHLKEHSATDDKALVGEGDVDWQQVFRLCEGVGKTEWYVVEQESYAYPPMECVDRCLQNLRAMGK